MSHTLRTVIAAMVALSTSAAVLAQPAQEKKPVPKDSVRVSLSGCVKGYMFTVGARMADIIDGVNIQPGTHLRMNGPKKLISQVDAYTGSMVAITGIMKKGQFVKSGVALGPVQLSPAQPGTNGSMSPGAVREPPQIDLEGWAPATGACPS